MFVVPNFIPPTLEELTQEIDEVTVLVKREAQLNRELDDVQKYNKDATPLGVVRAAEVEVEPEEEAEPDEEVVSEDDELEEDEEEEEEDEDDDDADGMPLVP